MKSIITYRRGGRVYTVNIETRLIPTPVAVKFVVIEHEMGHCKDLICAKDHPVLEDLIHRMGIEILDVSATSDSVEPKPYTCKE